MTAGISHSILSAVRAISEEKRLSWHPRCRQSWLAFTRRSIWSWHWIPLCIQRLWERLIFFSGTGRMIPSFPAIQEPCMSIRSLQRQLPWSGNTGLICRRSWKRRMWRWSAYKTTGIHQIPWFIVPLITRLILL